MMARGGLAVRGRAGRAATRRGAPHLAGGVGALLVSLLVGSGRLGADDKVLVPAADDGLRNLLVRALGDVLEERFEPAVETFQEVISRGADRLVPIAGDGTAPLPEIREALASASVHPALLGGKGRSPSGRRFRRADLVAARLLARLPPEARAVYQARFGEPAGRKLEAFEASADVRLLRELAREYPVTVAGLRAREALADRWFEEARLGRSAREYRLLEADRREDAMSAARLHRKRVACAALAGNRQGGAEGEPEAPERAEGALPPLPGRLLRLSWDSWVWSRGMSIVDPLEEVRWNGRPLPPQLFRSARPYRFSAIDFPFVPLVDGSRIFISGVFGLHRIDGRPGAGRRVLEREYPDPSGLRSHYGYQERSDSPIYSLTLWKKAADPAARGRDDLPAEILLARYVHHCATVPRFMGYEIKGEIPTRALVAYDAGTGRELWRTTPDRRGGGGTEVSSAGEGNKGGSRPAGRSARGEDPFRPAEMQADISYTSSAVVSGGRVFCAGWNQAGYVNLRVRALDLATGKLQWDSLVVSGQMEQTMFGEVAREPFAAFLLLRDGLLYCQTNLGVVAALDPSTGRIAWVTTYDSIPTQSTNGPTARIRYLRWGVQPPLIVGGTLVVAPRDSVWLYGFQIEEDADDVFGAGRVSWVYDNSSGDLKDLLGHHRGRLYFTGPAGVGRLSLAGIDRSASPVVLPLGRREILPAPFRRGSLPARGTLSREGVVFCDRYRLWLADWSFKRATPIMAGTFPAPRRGSYSYPGRVSIAGSLVLVTSNRMISAWAPIRNG